MFWLAEDLPSSMIPGARARTTLCGSPGGDQQDQWSLLLLLRHLHHRLNLPEAIDAPMFNNMHFPVSFTPRASRPGVLSIESRFGPETLNELERCG
jgi:gamma-glutamyltranspeptidase / glutathione hydrolase